MKPLTPRCLQCVVCLFTCFLVSGCVSSNHSIVGQEGGCGFRLNPLDEMIVECWLEDCRRIRDSENSPPFFFDTEFAAFTRQSKYASTEALLGFVDACVPESFDLSHPSHSHPGPLFCIHIFTALLPGRTIPRGQRDAYVRKTDEIIRKWRCHEEDRTMSENYTVDMVVDLLGLFKKSVESGQRMPVLE